MRRLCVLPALVARMFCPLSSSVAALHLQARSVCAHGVQASTSVGFTVPHVDLGQPTPFTHPQMMGPDDVTVGVSFKDYRERRDRFFSLMPRHSIAVMIAKDPSIRAHDILFPYRQDTNFLYLTGVCEPGAVAIFSKSIGDERKFILFVKEKDTENELWHGNSNGVEGSKLFFAADECYPNDADSLSAVLGREINTLTAGCARPVLPRVYFTLPQFIVTRRGTPHSAHVIATSLLRTKLPGGADDGIGYIFPQHDLEQLFPLVTQPKFRRSDATQTIRCWRSLLWQLRSQKCSTDLKMFLRSAEITERCFASGMRASAADGSSEATVHNAMEHEARIRGAQGLAYIPVVAGGANALAIHSITNSAALHEGDLLLVDAGAELHGYPTDCTRTWPVSGRFTSAQRDLYEMLLAVQEELIAEIRVDVVVSALQVHAEQLLHRRLDELGVRSISRELTVKLFPHGFGHFFGMDIHETVLHTTKFEPGMMHTVEPGLYFPDIAAITRDKVEFARCGMPYRDRFTEAELAAIPPPLRGVGIRIEDNVVVVGSDDALSKELKSTAAAHGAAAAIHKGGNVIVTTFAIPKEIREIEAQVLGPRNCTVQ